VNDELIYANSERGFALTSMRSRSRSRYDIQCDLADRIEDWPDERFWDELKRRLGDDVAGRLITGPSIEKSIDAASLPSHCGSGGCSSRAMPRTSCHPTDAKGLNLAASDVYYLSESLSGYYRSASDAALAAYSELALRRVLASVRFSWWMTTQLHRFPDDTDFSRRIQQAELDYLFGSPLAQQVLADNYVGLGF
jgi:p-hydroxybenzoate 3-monooxygenase